VSVIPSPSTIPTPPPTSVTIGPVSGFVLLVILIALLKKIGILPPDVPDKGDEGDFASVTTVMAWVIAHRPDMAPLANIILASLQTKPITVYL